MKLLFMLGSICYAPVVVHCQGDPMPDVEPGQRLDLIRSDPSECDSGIVHGPNDAGWFRCEGVDF